MSGIMNNNTMKCTTTNNNVNSAMKDIFKMSSLCSKPSILMSKKKNYNDDYDNYDGNDDDTVLTRNISPPIDAGPNTSAGISTTSTTNSATNTTSSFNITSHDTHIKPNTTSFSTTTTRNNSNPILTQDSEDEKKFFEIEHRQQRLRQDLKEIYDQIKTALPEQNASRSKTMLDNLDFGVGASVSAGAGAGVGVGSNSYIRKQNGTSSIGQSRNISRSRSRGRSEEEENENDNEKNTIIGTARMNYHQDKNKDRATILGVQSQSNVHVKRRINEESRPWRKETEERSAGGNGGGSGSGSGDRGGQENNVSFLTNHRFRKKTAAELGSMIVDWNE